MNIENIFEVIINQGVENKRIKLTNREKIKIDETREIIAWENIESFSIFDSMLNLEKEYESIIEIYQQLRNESVTKTKKIEMLSKKLNDEEIEDNEKKAYYEYIEDLKKDIADIKIILKLLAEKTKPILKKFQSLKETISSNEKISGIERKYFGAIIDMFLKNANDLYKEKSPETEIVEPTNQILGEKELRKIMTNIITNLPEKEIATKKTWKNITFIDLGPQIGLELFQDISHRINERKVKYEECIMNSNYLLNKAKIQKEKIRLLKEIINDETVLANYSPYIRTLIENAEMSTIIAKELNKKAKTILVSLKIEKQKVLNECQNKMIRDYLITDINDFINFSKKQQTHSNASELENIDKNPNIQSKKTLNNIIDFPKSNPVIFPHTIKEPQSFAIIRKLKEGIIPPTPTIISPDIPQQSTEAKIINEDVFNILGEKYQNNESNWNEKLIEKLKKIYNNTKFKIEVPDKPIKEEKTLGLKVTEFLGKGQEKIEGIIVNVRKSLKNNFTKKNKNIIIKGQITNIRSSLRNIKKETVLKLGTLTVALAIMATSTSIHNKNNVYDDKISNLIESTYDETLNEQEQLIVEQEPQIEESDIKEEQSPESQEIIEQEQQVSEQKPQLEENDIKEEQSPESQEIIEQEQQIADQIQNNKIATIKVNNDAKIYRNSSSAYLDEGGQTLYWGTATNKVILGVLLENTATGEWQYIYINNSNFQNEVNNMIANGWDCLSALIGEEAIYSEIIEEGKDVTISVINKYLAAGWINAKDINNQNNMRGRQL